MSADTGGSQVVVYLDSVTDGQINALVGDISDLLRAHNLATDPNTDSPVRSVVAVRPFAWPAEVEDMVGGHLRDAAMFVIPTTVED